MNINTLNFVEAIGPDVSRVCKEWGLFPAICMAQAILESKSGQSELALNANNIFGKKWNEGKFEPYYKVTNEYLTCSREEAEAAGFELVDESSGLYRKMLPFNYYNSWAESINHYCENIMKSKWYAPAREYLEDPDEFLEAMAKIYAPNHPSYADTIRRLIAEYD